MENLSTRQKYAMIGIGIALLIGGYIFLHFKNNNDIIVTGAVEASADKLPETKTPEKPPETMPTPKEIIVHVSGAVKSPGIVRLTQGSRVFDAVEKAGGGLKNSDMDKLNLASLVGDGEKIYVPKIGEKFEEPMLSASGTSKSSGTVNINTASASQLEGLPEIGPATSQKIIDYRKKNGLFKKIEEIKNVPGIGDKKFEKLKKYITI